jgi:hypothetical protein
LVKDAKNLRNDEYEILTTNEAQLDCIRDLVEDLVYKKLGNS